MTEGRVRSKESRGERLTEREQGPTQSRSLTSKLPRSEGATWISFKAGGLHLSEQRDHLRQNRAGEKH